MNVPLIDLKAQYRSIKEEVDGAVARVLERGNYVMGEEVEAFEEEWGRYCGAKYCVGVGSGTDALHLALWALTNRETDEGPGGTGVLTTPFTFFATGQAIWQAGLELCLQDVDMETGNIDLASVDGYTIAVPVHLYGRPVKPWDKHLVVVEDSAQAHGQPLRGLAACFSFYPTKPLGACGQAGAVVTNDQELAQEVRELRVYGERERFVQYALTGNHRLDEMQASILRAKLPHLNRWNAARRAVAALYMQLLGELPGIVVPPFDPDHSYHIFAIRVTDPRGRDALAEFLASHGIATAVRYPVPLHLQPALAFLYRKEGDYPNAERWAREVLTLPIYPEMTGEMVDYVCEEVRAWSQQ